MSSPVKETGIREMPKRESSSSGSLLDLDKLSLGPSATGPSGAQSGGKKTLQRKGHFEGSSSASRGGHQQQQQQNNSKPPRRAQKDMTKKERRELQERQKAEKAAGLLKPSSGGGNHKGKKNPSFQTGASSSSAGHHTLSAQSSVVDMGGRGSFLGSPQGTPSSTTMGGAVRSTPLAMRADDSKKRAKTDRAGGLHRVRSKKPVALFSHLVQYERLEHLTSELKAPGLIHPAVLSLGLQFSEFLLAGGHARCLAMLRVFQRVISDYVTPSGISLQRHLTSHLSKQVDFLNSTRALAASMKSAIKELKLEISRLSIDLPDEDAKQSLCDKIDDYINASIEIPDNAIIKNMFEHKKLRNGDIVLTHAFSSVVLDLFCTAWKKGIAFEVIVCDSRPKMEGRELLKRLSEEGIPCTYILSQALPIVMKKVTKVIMGASSIFSNGAVMSRVGTAVVATLAHYFRVPVIILCQAYKFSDAVRLDSFVWNEIGNPEEIVDIRSLGPSNKCPRILSPNEPLTGPLSPWRDIQSLKILNIHYDVTPAKFVTMVCCDHGCIPPTACLSVLREIQSTK